MNSDAQTPRIDWFGASAREFKDWPIKPDIFEPGMIELA
jgi:hypothetical protein